MGKYNEIDLSAVKRYSTMKRCSKVSTGMSARPPVKGMTLNEFFKNLPQVLKADNFLSIAQAVVNAKKKKKPIIAMIGGHVIKTGLTPVLIDLLEKGYISHMASNGSVAVHDTELALFGHTSEDVASQLEDGSFGMAEETADMVNLAAIRASQKHEGFGEALGAYLNEKKPSKNHATLIGRCYELNIPYTLHVAMGTDIVHQHPSSNGAAIGDASHRDFRIFAQSISKLGDGGVVLNFGSAVVMPEVFLKALSVARNLTHDVKNFVTANFDMIQHYRPHVNIVNRPVLSGGFGYAITGHHEIMIPLFAAAILEAG